MAVLDFIIFITLQIKNVYPVLSIITRKPALKLNEHYINEQEIMLKLQFLLLKRKNQSLNLFCPF